MTKQHRDQLGRDVTETLAKVAALNSGYPDDIATVTAELFGRVVASIAIDGNRTADALESIAKSLEKLANPLLFIDQERLTIPADQASIAARIIATDHLDDIPYADVRSLAGWVLDKVDAKPSMAEAVQKAWDPESGPPPNSVRHGARPPGAHPRDRRP